MSVNVYTTVSGVEWSTEKCRIATGNTAVTYNVLNTTTDENIYSQANQVPPHTIAHVFVGIGNELTVTGSDFTATESGSKGRT